MKSLEITKRNRKYFSALLDGKCKCKILIDSASSELEIGAHVLEVDDISVRSKYGTDLIFKLSASIDEQQNAGICTLRSETYNSILVARCRELGGKWDGDQSAWVFSGLVENEVEKLDEHYNSSLIGVEIIFNNSMHGHQQPVFLAGYTLATANGRDSGARISEGVSVISGGFSSGGSMRNWQTVASQGTVIRMQIPELVLLELESNSGEDVTISRI